MRPTTRSQSALRAPLNRILGTEAAVRVLRVLSLSEAPRGVSDLAREAALQVSGVAVLCRRMEDLGVLEALGRGPRGRQYGLAPRHPLRRAIIQLFQAERAHADEVLDRLRAAVSSSSLVRAAWLEGPVATAADRPGDVIVVGMLADAGELDAARGHVWPSLLTLQRQADLAIELRGMTMADLRTADTARLGELERVLLLHGPAPLDLARPAPALGGGARSGRRRHEDLDARALRIARAVAERLRRDPSLREAAQRQVRRRLAAAPPRERAALEEWRDLLASLSLPRLRRLLVEESPRATRLRQSLPFVDALSAAERRALLTAADRS